MLTHDRVEADTFPLTQEFLATMLGVHRPSVSLAAGHLQQAGVSAIRIGIVTSTKRPIALIPLTYFLHCSYASNRQYSKHFVAKCAILYIQRL
ncbi:MAG: helix-turn-helix domain-containing protein [Vulcanimicrobiaceae bacterium]